MELGATVCKPTSPSCTECPLHTVCSARILVEYATKDKKEMKNKSPIFDVEVISIDNENQGIDSHDSISLKQKKKSAKKAVLVLDYEIDLTHDEVAELEDTNLNDTGLNKDGLPISISYFPQKKKKNEAKEILVSVSVFVWNDNRGQKMCDVEDRYLFIRRPNKGGLLANQWEFPNVIISDDAIDEFNLECDTNKTKQKMKTISISQTELKNKIKSKIKSKKEESTPGNIQNNPTPEFLWAPMPLFLEKTVGIDWISYYQSRFKEIQVSSSSGKSSLITAESENKLVSTRKRKSISTVTSTQSDIEENQSGVCVIKLDKLSDLKKTVIRVEAVCPCIALPPIIHVFSHQRHTMHVTLSTVEVHKEPIYNEDSKSLDRLQPLNKNNLMWESSCGEKREIRWMTASEINSAGITSGCKKILTEVLKMQKNSKIT